MRSLERRPAIARVPKWAQVVFVLWIMLGNSRGASGAPILLEPQAGAGATIVFLGQAVPIALGIATDLATLFANWPTGVEASLTVSATATSLEWTLLGGSVGILADEYRLDVTTRGLVDDGVLADLWKLSIQVKEVIPVFRSESIFFTGFVQHVMAPHRGEPREGPMLPYNMNVRARRGRTTDSDMARRRHGRLGHVDTLMTTVSAGREGGEIQNFNMQGTAEHVVPEPATLLLLGSGLAGLARVARGRRRRREPSTSTDA